MNAIVALLAVVALSLAAVVAAELRPSPDPTPDAAPPSAQAAGGQPDAATAPAAAADRSALIATLLGRPPFSASRRPVDPASPAADTGAPTATLPRMTAILIDGSHRSAIFAGSNGDKPVTLSEGGRLGQFTIQRIEPEQVVVLGPDGRQTVRTSFDPNPPAPVAALTVGSPVIAPQFPGIVLPNGSPVLTPGGRLPGGQQFPPVPPGAGYGAAR